jgi:cytochrome c
MPPVKYLFILFPILFAGTIGHFANVQKNTSPHHRFQNTNHAPTVKILQPSRGTSFTLNAQVPYSVQVSDIEDGESKYQEIQTAEVLIRLQFFTNSTNAEASIKQKMTDTAGVGAMLVSNCFNCHALKAKRAGPSFQDISLKYPATEKNISIMLNRIRNGSTGIWGNEVMPSHPELPEQEIRKMVIWLLRYSNNPKLNFYSGLEGILTLAKPDPQTRSGYFVVTAMYTDHGIAEKPGEKLTGSDQVMIRVK